MHLNPLPAITTAALLVVAGCATTTTLAPTALNPASEGKIIAREGPNENTELAIRLEHLPEPQVFDPSLDTYVAWVRPSGGGEYVNVGQIAIDSDRQGMLNTVTPYDHLDVLVTAEFEATAQTPSKYVMLRGEVERQRRLMDRLRGG